MNMLRLIGNVLWFIFSGLWLGLTWWLAGVLAIIFIVTIPWAKAAFVLGNFCFFPFGRTVIDRETLSGQRDIGTGIPGAVGNIIWFIFAGFWIALFSVLTGIAWFITIIGIPFGIQSFKIAGAALAPIGKTVVSLDMADLAGKEAARRQFEKFSDK